MPEYEVTRADGTTSTLAADGLGNAVERAGGHPEPVSVRLTTPKHTAGPGMAGGQQARHQVPLAGARTVGQCPVPGCDYISSALGELRAHGLDEHGFAAGVAKHG
jgi:hypothetical protein